MRQQRHLLPDLLALVANVQTEHAQLADGGTGGGCDQPKERSLTRTVGSGEKQRFAPGQRITDAGECPLGTEPFADVSQLDRGVVLHRWSENYPCCCRARSKIGKTGVVRDSLGLTSARRSPESPRRRGEDPATEEPRRSPRNLRRHREVR